MRTSSHTTRTPTYPPTSPTLHTLGVNGFIDGKDIVYHDFVNISIAVAGPKGLVTPVIKGA
jgi:hypothetical protein